MLRRLLGLGLAFCLGLVGPARAQESSANHAFERAAVQIWGLRPAARQGCFSPVSLWLALGLVEGGSAPPTNSDFYRFFGLDKGEYRRQLDRLRLELGDARDHGMLTSSLAIWVQADKGLQPAFLARVKALGAEAVTTNLSNAVKACERINGWFSRRTAGKIDKLLSARDLLDADMIVGHALLLKARWAKPFDPKNTRPEPFFLENSIQSVSVPTMHRQASLRCLLADQGESTDFSLVELDYAGGNWVFDVLMPTQAVALERVEKELTEEKLRQSLARMEPHDLALALPRFQVHSKLDLREPLMRLGLVGPMSPRANFSGIFPEGSPSHLSKIVQEVDLQVNEEGTEAAAATAAVSNRSLPVMFSLNRPFLFFVRHRRSGTLLFMGRYCGEPK